eukprot:7304380-Prymnesium_polylepis.1
MGALHSMHEGGVVAYLQGRGWWFRSVMMSSWTGCMISLVDGHGAWAVGAGHFPHGGAAV